MKNLAIVLFIIVVNTQVLAEQTIGLFINEKEAFQGYTLFSPRHYHGTFLIGMDGKLVHKWEHTERVENAKLLRNGQLLRAVNLLHPNFRRRAGAHGRIELVNWDGSVAWYYEHITETEVLHHDFVPLPNGNVLMSVFQAKSNEEAVALGRKPETLPGTRLIAERIIEVKPRGKSGGDIVWSWSAWDHLVQDVDPQKPNFGQIKDNPGRINLNYVRRPNEDWNHVSALDYHAELDLIMITLHGNDEVVIIDHSTTIEEAMTKSGGRYGKGGELLYRWGNPQTYGEGSNADRRYFAIHNAHWIPEGLPNAGKVLLLDNQFQGPNSSVELVTIPVTAGKFTIPRQGKPEGWPEITVLYNDFHTRNMGGVQQLPNGNLLIDDAVHGRFFEITPEKKIVWEYVNPVQRDGPMGKDEEIPANRGVGDLLNECFRVTRIAPDHPALTGKDLTPQGVIEKPAGTVTVRVQPQQLQRDPQGRQAAMGRQGPGRQQVTFHPSNLTAEQQTKYDAIIAEYRGKRMNVFRQARGDREKIISAMQVLSEEQNKQMRGLLTDGQFKQYMEWMDQQTRQRRGGPSGGQRQPRNQ